MRLSSPTPRLLFVSGSTLLALVIVAYGVGRLIEHEPQAPPETISTQPVTVQPEFAFARVDIDTSSPLAATVRWETTEPSTADVAWGPAGVQPLLWRAATEPLAV